jgi:hypothetical protein
VFCLLPQPQLFVLATRVLISTDMAERHSPLDEDHSPRIKRPRCSGKRQRAASSKKRILCIEDDFEATENLLPCGPSSLDEIANWPEDLLLRAGQQGPAAQTLLLDFFRILRFTTDYSGWDGPREMMHQMYKALSRPLSYHQGAEFWSGFGYKPLCHFTRACENSSLPLQVLEYKAVNLDGGRSCLFKSIEGALADSDLMRELAEMIPHIGKAKMTQEEKEENAKGYADVLEKIMLEREAMFGVRPSSYCCIHERECFCDSLDWDELGSDARDQALRFNVAGTTCIGWSSVGTHGRHAHESELIHALWMTQRIVQCERGREDGFFQDIHKLSKCVVFMCDHRQCRWLH